LNKDYDRLTQNFHQYLARFFKLINFLGSKLMFERKDCNSFVELGCGAKSPAVEYVCNINSVGINGYLTSLRANKKSGYFNDYILADLTHLHCKPTPLTASQPSM
jgi:hypothetical protein